MEATTDDVLMETGKQHTSRCIAAQQCHYGLDTDVLHWYAGAEEYDELDQLDFECSSDELDIWGDEATERGKTPDAEEEEEEADPKRLMQRQKQIDFGKNTKGYERYIQAVPK